MSQMIASSFQQAIDVVEAMPPEDQMALTRYTELRPDNPLGHLELAPVGC